MYGLFYLFLIAAVAVIGAFIFAYTPAKRLVYILDNILPIGSIALGVVLTLAGRGIVGLPLIGIGLAVWQRNRATAKKLKQLEILPAIFASEEIEITISKKTVAVHADAVDGKMLTGRFADKKLSTLTLSQLIECSTQLKKTSEGRELFEAYLDRKIPGWRENAQFNVPRRSRKAAGTGAMTKQQAYQILGLKLGASADQIGQTHGFLVDRVDPERTNKGIFATKLNAAMNLLL